MKLEIDIPKHQYNNIMSLDSINLGRVPYKGIIMYAINAIKRGKTLEQESTTKNDLAHNLCDSCTNIGCVFQSGIVRTKCAFYMPSVTPKIEPRKGHWINTDATHSKCNRCGALFEIISADGEANFCPNCGADMREAE